MKSFKVWKPNESFLVVEILPGRVNGLLLGLTADLALTPRKFFEDSDWATLAKRPALRHLVKNIVISADSSFAYTALVPVRLKRENPNHPLSAVELENLLALEVGKIFSQCRKDASTYLGIDELDVILITSRVLDFKIDGHKVLNPLEFRASEIETVLELILTTRTIYGDIKLFTKNRQDFFFTELTRSELRVLQKTEKLPMSILRLQRGQSAYAVMESGKVGPSIARGVFPWTTAELAGALEDEWKVNKELGERIYQLFLDGETSERAGAAIGKILAPAEQAFWKALKEVHLKGPVYVDSDGRLPWKMPLTKFSKTLVPAPVGTVMEHFGFRAEFEKWPVPHEELFRLLAPFLDYYSDRSDTTINRWLRRHLNWLGSSL